MNDEDELSLPSWTGEQFISSCFLASGFCFLEYETPALALPIHSETVHCGWIPSLLVLVLQVQMVGRSRDLTGFIVAQNHHYYWLCFYRQPDGINACSDGEVMAGAQNKYWTSHIPQSESTVSLRVEVKLICFQCMSNGQESATLEYRGWRNSVTLDEHSINWTMRKYLNVEFIKKDGLK